MEDAGAIGIYIPSELLDGFLKLMEVGLDKVKIPQADRLALSAWWSVEKELVVEEARKI